MDADAQALVADFSATPVTGCGPLAVNFTDHSTGGPLYWNWDFGNGQTSHVQNPSTFYTTPGLYTVRLQVVNKNGQNSLVKVNYINVSPYPVAFFNSNLTLACAPAHIQFFDHSTPGQGYIAQWKWDFGDGATSALQNPVHIYSQPGYYTVGLTVTNSQGCSYTAAVSRFLRVVAGVQSDFAYVQTSGSCSAPFQLNFTNQTSGPGTLTYSWDLGNGAGSNQANPSTTYPISQSYTVILTTQSSLGCSDTSEKIIIFPAANAVITGPDSACANTPINFKNGSSPAPTSSTWSFGDGNASTQQNPANTYGAVGNYPVKLINTYSTCADSITKTIVIVNNPIAAFTTAKPGSCKAPFNASFQDASTPGAVKWLWDFGDGGASIQQNPSHNYTTTGSFDVTLTVTNSAGCSNTLTKPKFIQILGPTATLNNPTEQGCVNTDVFSPVATVNSVDGISAYSWSAVGATPATSASATPSFTYAAPGNYDISLTLTTNDGCSSTTVFSDAATVGTPTPAAFTAAPTNTCRSTPVVFNSSSSPADQWIWDFGDGVVVTTDTPYVYHYYKKQGFRQIRLTVVNHGCSQSTASASTFILINPPIAKFGYTTQCGVNKYLVNFIDTSAIDPAQATTYTWDFGDGSPPQIFNIPAGMPAGSETPLAHTYSALGNYTVILTVANATCPDMAQTVVTLDSLPVSFSVPDTVCRNANFTMVSTSANPSLITNYSWTVGLNSPVSTDSSSFYSFNPTVNGPLGIRLTVTDINGCMFTSLLSTTQVVGPAAKFDTTSPGGCRNSPILFIDQSTIDPYPIQDWAFIFGDGNDIDFRSPPFTHQYADTGYYNVQLTVQDTHNCVESFILDSAVRITAPHAGFFAKDTLYCPNEPLPFTDSSQGQSLSWLWDFGDGNSSTLQSPSNSYSINGQYYSVKLKVTDQTGCSDSVTRTSYIHIQHPIAAFSIQDSTSICTPLQTTFVPNPQFYDSLYWDFGDGTTSTLANTTHFYNTYDTFYAKLFLQGAGGCLDSATRRIFILDPYTITSLTYENPLKACDSLPMNFLIVPPGFTKYSLLFGDGAVDSSGNTMPFHMFRKPNIYAQQLQLQDSTGCIVIIGGVSQVVVLGAIPFFSIDKHSFCDSSVVNFTDFTSTNDPITGETWNFGDGVSTTQANPSYDYSTPGVFLPSLKVTTQSNCTETYTDTVKVYQTPHPVFTFSNQTCASTPVQFMGNLAQPDPDSVDWAWNFGDGQNSDQQNPTITYRQPGNYKVTLHTSIPFGCGDTTSQQVILHALPSIKGPREITAPVGFPTLLPMTYSGGIISYSWTPVANLSCTDCPNPLAAPIFNTEYTILITDSNDCSTTDSVLVKTICNGKNYFIPNTFSPNGDGVNDVFYPRGDNLYNIQTMRVFNRWGQMVFEKRDFPANSAASGWDGTFNGRPAPVDVYAYIVEVVCDNAQVVALSGNVTLVR